MFSKEDPYDKKEFGRIYAYSTLQYFHDELGITTKG